MSSSRERHLGSLTALQHTVPGVNVNVQIRSVKSELGKEKKGKAGEREAASHQEPMLGGPMAPHGLFGLK